MIRVLQDVPKMSEGHTAQDANQNEHFAKAQKRHLPVLLKIYRPTVTLFYLLFFVLVFPANAMSSRASAPPPVADLDTTRTVSSPAIVPMISFIPE
jgi:hypothetical protein